MKADVIFVACVVLQIYVPLRSAAHETPKTNDVPLGTLTYKSDPNKERNITAEKMTFKKFTYYRHGQRLEAVKSIIQLKTYAKQYNMLETVLPKMFEILLESRVILESSGYVPGEDWPLNMTVRDAMAQVVENTLFFGEMVLRLPDIAQRLLKKNKEWEVLIHWAWAFSQECIPFLHEKLHKPLNLMAHALRFEKVDPALYEQFKIENDFFINEALEPKKEKKPRKPRREKGPMMSSGSTGEL